MADAITKSTPTAQPVYKYKEHIEKHAPKNCPPTQAKEINIVAYRWVRKPIEVDDFKSHYSLDRHPPKATEKFHLECKYCGLSLFTTIDFAELGLRKAWKRTTIPYTHIAEGKILESYGVCTSANDDGHFTIHEYAGIDLIPFFKIVKEI